MFFELKKQPRFQVTINDAQGTDHLVTMIPGQPLHVIYPVVAVSENGVETLLQNQEIRIEIVDISN